MASKRIGIALIASGSLAGSAGFATAQVTERVSVDAAGVEGNGFSAGSVALSFDGRFVAFDSLASNLVPGDTNGSCDVFVRDRLTGTTECASVDSAGAIGSGDSLFPTISADGRFVAFESRSSNLVSGDHNGRFDAFVHDRATGTTERVSVDSSGTEQNGSDYFDVRPAISADGRYVVFMSNATNLVPADANGAVDIFVHDRVSGTTERVSVDGAGGEGNDNSAYPSISADGRFVAFSTGATNFVEDDVNGDVLDVYLHDRQTGTTVLASADSTGRQGNGASDASSISADGRFVAFFSACSDWAGDTNVQSDAFVRDMVTGTLELASISSSGAQGDSASDVGAMPPSISADGRFVSIRSLATNLTTGDTNGVEDAFVHDRVTGSTLRASVSAAGAEGNAETYNVSISGDGRFVGFVSFASNLVEGDTNAQSDVFVRGPRLTLEAQPPEPPAGAAITLSTWTGEPSGLALLAVVDIDGAPMFVPAALSTFDARGVWLFSSTVPQGLAGSLWTLQSFGFVPTGRVEAANLVKVAFR